MATSSPRCWPSRPASWRRAASAASRASFISHGTRDRVLPIDHTSREIVPRLERGGYDVQYREFDGGHIVPPVIAREAVSWFLTGS